MQDRQIHLLEKKIQNQLTLNKALQEELQFQKQVIHDLKEKVSDLENITQQGPLHLTQQLSSPLTTESKTSAYAKILQSIHNQLSQEKVRTQFLTNELIEREASIFNYQEQYQQKNQELESSRLTTIKLENIKKIHENHIEKLQNDNRKLRERINELMGENLILKEKTNEKQALREQNLCGLAEGLLLLSKNRENNQGQLNLSHKDSHDNQDLLRILEVQQGQLQYRNEENHRLWMRLQGISLSDEQAHLKVTNRHLRTELGKYNQLITRILEKQKVVESLQQKYEKAYQKIQYEINHISNLEREKLGLIKEVEDMRLKLQRANKQLDEEEKLKKEKMISFIEVLKENQCYHDLMNTLYPNDYSSIIRLKVEEYKQRVKKRKAQQKWASVEELVEVNENFRRKNLLIS